MTPLHWAARKGHVNILKELIKYNAQINVFDLVRNVSLEKFSLKI